MKQKYITLEEMLALRGTNTKIYTEYEFGYCMFVGDILCSYKKDGTLKAVGTIMSNNDKHYILEPEEFKVEKTGKYRTRYGRIAWIDVVYNNNKDGCFCRGIITGENKITRWSLNGKRLGTLQNITDEDLSEYIGETK